MDPRRLFRPLVETTMTAAVTASLIVGILGFMPNTAAAADLEGRIKVDGSSTVFPITEAMAEEFQKANPKVKVTVGVSGTGGGFKKFAAGEIDINNASRPIKPEEISKAKEAGISYLELPIAYDGITIVINPKNTFAKSMTLAELKKLWEPGSKVKTWQDINPKWPANPIKLYGPGADSGTFEFFTEAIVGKAKASRNDYTASEDDNTLVNGIAGDVNAIGYFGYAYFVENKSKLQAVALDTGKGPIAPSDKTISNQSYGLSRMLFLCINSKAASNPAVDGFVRFYLKNAKEMSAAVGYTALPDSLYSQVTMRYETKKTGSWNASSSH